MTREIPYIKKQTSATTQYNAITSTDMNWLFDQCKSLIQVSNLNVKECVALNAPNVLLPRQTGGKRNSAASMCEGILDNFTNGQYDLTQKQMDALVECFRIATDIIEDFDSVTFIEVDQLPKIKSSVSVTNEPNGERSDLFRGLPSELFEIESVVVTYRTSITKT